jgi:hypothetical protein
MNCSKHDKRATSLQINKPVRERYRKIKILRRLLLQILFPIVNQVHMMKYKNRRKRRWRRRRKKRRRISKSLKPQPS